MFVIQMPPDFDRAVDRGESPGVLIDADATDPTAIGNAVAALGQVADDLNRDLPPIRQMQPQTPPFQFVVHARYNPEQLTVLNVVPGLVCIVLMFSTLFVTTMAITKERERGTMENLLAMPVRPIEVMIAKIAPYVVIGYIQVILILVAASIFFALPIRGSVPLLLGALGIFIASNLALGVTFSTVSANQMQAVQLAQFTLMPSFMLSGFMFPFRGMPVWAQVARATSSRRPTRCGSCAACCSRATAGARSRRSCGRWRCSPSWSLRLRLSLIAKRWTDLRGAYMLDIARQLSSDNALIRFARPGSPTLIQVHAGAPALYVLIPLRV